MFFIAKNTEDYSRDDFRATIISEARSCILLYRLLANECEINNYLEKKYKLTLKEACLNLLSDIKIVFDSNDNATILFRDKKSNDLATLITYGNSSVHGSKILRDAFYWGD